MFGGKGAKWCQVGDVGWGMMNGIRWVVYGGGDWYQVGKVLEW